MGYYALRLTPNAQKLCTIVFPWGKYSYLRLPMGIANSPDIFQSKINQLMDGLDYVRAYLDDILIVTKNTYDDHLNKLDTVLQRLHAANLKINIEKSTFATTDVRIFRISYYDVRYSPTYFQGGSDTAA